MNVFKTTLIAAALATAGLAGNAVAASADASFTVNLSIDGSCRFIAADNITFPAQAAQAGTVNATGRLVVQCTNALPFTLSLDEGDNGANVNARAMSNGTSDVAYQLYTASNAVWGADTGTGTGTGFGSGAPYDHSFVVNATATLVGTETVGNYTDTVTATVTY